MPVIMISVVHVIAHLVIEATEGRGTDISYFSSDWKKYRLH